MTPAEVALLNDYYGSYSTLQSKGYPASLILSECWKEESMPIDS
jgi:hypothetical protein